MVTCRRSVQREEVRQNERTGVIEHRDAVALCVQVVREFFESGLNSFYHAALIQVLIARGSMGGDEVVAWYDGCPFEAKRMLRDMVAARLVVELPVDGSEVVKTYAASGEALAA